MKKTIRNAVLLWTVCLIHAHEHEPAAPPNVLTVGEPGSEEIFPFTVHRLPRNPIILPDIIPDADQDNIMSATLVHVPKWVQHPKGKYYLYFGRHHHEANIFMAYSNHINGPYKLHSEPVLNIEDTVYKGGNHICAPAVYPNSKTKTFEMVFHGQSKQSGHNQSYASSKDGLTFTGANATLGNSSALGYLHAIREGDHWLGIGKSGRMYTAPDLAGPWTAGRALPPEHGIKRWRHADLLEHKGRMWALYSALGDTPERIRAVEILSRGKKPKVSDPIIVLTPEHKWEGADLPVTTGKNGEAKLPVHALRDPTVFKDADGKMYILYSVKGEFGIAIAELKPVN